MSWEDNSQQFCRLLGELAGVGLTAKQYKYLMESMDVTRPMLDEIMDRAMYEWEINVKFDRQPAKETSMRDLRAFTGNNTYQS